ncbi:hypothetical protein FQR65_LT07736 [Abscondita terminalis]|nr:hypothetical protein FQR65_LT07736 [Abscondita terminalis]
MDQYVQLNLQLYKTILRQQQYARGTEDEDLPKELLCSPDMQQVVKDIADTGPIENTDTKVSHGDEDIFQNSADREALAAEPEKSLQVERNEEDT